jgi:hypothetical protein
MKSPMSWMDRFKEYKAGPCLWVEKAGFKITGHDFKS